MEYFGNDPIDINIQFRKNDLDGDIIYQADHHFKRNGLIWMQSGISLQNYHTIYIRVNKDNEILYYQKIVYSTDIRTFNMYQFLLKKFKEIKN